MRRIYSFLIIILMVSALPVFAQKGTRIKSKIVSTDNTPLQGAIVSVVGTSSSVVSDENGAFELTTDLSKGTLRIVAGGFYTREYPLKSGYQDMRTRPYNTVGVQHSLTRGNGYTENNYGKFTQKGTNYQNTIDAKKAAEQARIAEAEAAKAAAIKAEQEAAERLAASRPKVNTGKMFNKNIEEFKCVEETRADGSIVRRYFDPYASNGNSNPMITTIDRGNYHEEIIYDPRKDIKLTYKQIGSEQPEIEMKKGLRFRYTSKYHKDGYAHRENMVYYNDGQSYVKSSGKGYYDTKHMVTKNPHSPERQAQLGEPEYITPNDYLRVNSPESWKAINKHNDEIKQEIDNNRIDLMDLFTPYQA